MTILYIYIYLSLFTHFYFGMCKNNESFFTTNILSVSSIFWLQLHLDQDPEGRERQKICIIVLLVSPNKDAAFVLTSEGKVE